MGYSSGVMGFVQEISVSRQPLRTVMLKVLGGFQGPLGIAPWSFFMYQPSNKENALWRTGDGYFVEGSATYGLCKTE